MLLVTWEAMNDIVVNGTDEDRASIFQHQCIHAFGNIHIGDPKYNIFLLFSPGNWKLVTAYPEKTYIHEFLTHVKLYANLHG